MDDLESVSQQLVRLWSKVNLEQDLPARCGYMMTIDSLVSQIKDILSTTEENSDDAV